MPPTLLVKGNLEFHGQLTSGQLANYVPIDYTLDFIEKLRLSQSTELKNRVLILKSRTGSGKSTALPAKLYQKFFIKDNSNAGRRILSTQPRKLTSQEIPVTITESGHYPFLKLGENIGYSNSEFKERINHGLLFVTLGTLTAQLKSMTDEQFIDTYQIIIIDEAHERSTNLDLTLLLLKNFLKRNLGNQRLPVVIVTSATLDEHKYAGYFECDRENIISVVGTQSVVVDYYMAEDTNNYEQEIVNIVRRISKNTNDEDNMADVLIFLLGIKYIKGVQKVLEKLLEDNEFKKPNKQFKLLTLDREASSTKNYDYRMSLGEIPLPKDCKRRIIMATNVAETGLTIPTLKYVIDLGISRSAEHNPLGLSMLISKPAAKSMIIQRRGRVGRIADGVFYPLYSKKTFESLQEIQYPDIVVSELSKEILSVVTSLPDDKEFDVTNLELLDEPPIDSVQHSIEKLYFLGFIDHNIRVTETGKLANQFSKLNVECIKMIMAGYAWEGCILDLITIAAFVQNPKAQYFIEQDYESNMENIINYCEVEGFDKDAFYKFKYLVGDDFIEILYVYFAYRKFLINEGISIDIMDKFCNKFKVNGKNMYYMLATREEIIDDMVSADMNILYGQNKSLYNCRKEDFMNILTGMKYCIFEGFKQNSASFNGKKYVMRLKHLELKMPNLLSSGNYITRKKKEWNIDFNSKPKNIVYSGAELKQGFKSPLYSVKVNYVSILDGFVNFDDLFV